MVLYMEPLGKEHQNSIKTLSPKTLVSLAPRSQRDARGGDGESESN